MWVFAYCKETGVQPVFILTFSYYMVRHEDQAQYNHQETHLGKIITPVSKSKASVISYITCSTSQPTFEGPFS